MLQIKMKDRTLQVCFILDCTASMQPWIDAATEKIIDILESIEERYPECQISAAFVGYRDFHDEEQFIRFDFTNDVHWLRDMLMDIEAEGGDDTCEDVAGAYRFVNGLTWFADVKCVFHITDAPNHGLTYHEKNVDDDYPEGHPYIDLKTEVRELASKGIDLTLFSIKPATDIMYRIIRSNYNLVRKQGFDIINLVNVRYNVNNVFYSEVSQRILNSLSSDPHSP